MYNVPFATGILNCLVSSRERKSLSEEMVWSISSNILFGLGTRLHIEPNHATLGSPQEFVDHQEWSLALHTMWSDYGADLAQLMAHCLSFQAEEEVHEIIDGILEMTQCMGLESFYWNMFPFLQSFTAHLEDGYWWWNLPMDSEDGENLTQETIHRLYMGILRAYLQEFTKTQLGPRPQRPANWVRSTVPQCELRWCRDCHMVNRFLRSPTESLHRWKAGPKRLFHLERLMADHVGCTIETDHSTFPATMVIKKIMGEYEQLDEKWRASLRPAKEAILSLGYPALTRYVSKHTIEPLEDSQWFQEALNINRPLASRQGQAASTTNSTRTPVSIDAGPLWAKPHQPEVIELD
jgi:hypothetical protein